MILTHNESINLKSSLFKKYRAEQSTFARIVFLNSSDGDVHRTHGER